MTAVNLDVQEAKELHKTGKSEKLHGTLNSGLLKAAVYGANDGIITTFAVVAGVAGAGLSPSIVLILGIANLIADGLSMGIGDYLGERSERKHKKYQYAVEKWEVQNIPKEEKAELIEYFASRGVKSSEAHDLANIITKYPKLWTELGFIDEMGEVPNFDGGVWKTGLMTFFAFLIAGSLPLLPYFLEFIGVPILESQQFNLSIVSTACALFFVGSLRTLITKGRWWLNGLEMLGIGAIAATVAYFLGAVIEGMVR
jgi:VIT1/CCC1 family predicted Fe2+/Mn2+ transporter